MHLPKTLIWSTAFIQYAGQINNRITRFKQSTKLLFVMHIGVYQLYFRQQDQISPVSFAVTCRDQDFQAFGAESVCKPLAYKARATNDTYSIYQHSDVRFSLVTG